MDWLKARARGAQMVRSGTTPVVRLLLLLAGVSNCCERQMASPKRKLKIASLNYWAVGRTKNSSHVALQINDEGTVVLRAKEAREIAIALQNEADLIARQMADREKR
jgi:hypothetical protein